MDWKNMLKGRKFLGLGILGGVVALSGLLTFLFSSGKIALPVLVEEEEGEGGAGQLFRVGVGELQIGEKTIRISRYRLDMGNLKITNLKEPTASADAATKGYVDASAGGVKYWEVCRTASTYNGNLGGYSGANDKCASGCGTGCVMLNYTHLNGALTGGVILVPRLATDAAGWIGAGGGGARWIPGTTTATRYLQHPNSSWWGDGANEQGADCNAWTDGSPGG